MKGLISKLNLGDLTVNELKKSVEGSLEESESTVRRLKTLFNQEENESEELKLKNHIDACKRDISRYKRELFEVDHLLKEHATTGYEVLKERIGNENNTDKEEHLVIYIDNSTFDKKIDIENLCDELYYRLERGSKTQI